MADGLNKVMIIGNLGVTPEMRYLSSGNAVANFSVAVNRTRRSPEGERTEETEWFRVVTFGQTAEFASQYLEKGRRVYVEGRLQTRTYEQDGQKRYITEVIAQQVMPLDSARQQGAPDYGGGGDMDPDDLPFEP
jgi:single-strand DNA-binding protein